MVIICLPSMVYWDKHLEHSFADFRVPRHCWRKLTLLIIMCIT